MSRGTELSVSTIPHRPYSALEAAAHDIQMLVSHSINQCLTICRVIDTFHSQILAHNLRQALSNLILIPFALSLISLVGIRCGDHCLRIRIGCAFVAKLSPSLGIVQLRYGTDISA